MNPKNKFWLFVGVSVGVIFAIVIGCCIYFWKNLIVEERMLILTILNRYSAYVFGAFILLIAIFFFAMDGILHNYIIPINRLAEETYVIAFVNPSHRIHIEGSRDIVRLAQTINEGAQRFESLKQKIDQKIEKAKAQAEEEKNMLAMFMSDMPEGILICNRDGQILFYNKKVKECFENRFVGKQDDSASGRFIGLGRSIFSVLDKELIVHALDEIGKNLKSRLTTATSTFVAVGKNGCLLRVEAVPILQSENQLNGFILIFEDITDQIEFESQTDYLLQSLIMSLRTSIASSRAAIEAIIDYPEMNPEQRRIFQTIIYNESLTIGSILDNAAVNYSVRVKSRWPLVQMPVENLLAALTSKIQEKIGASIHVSESDKQHWVKADSYSFIQSMLFIMNHLKDETDCTEFTVQISKQDKFVILDIYWIGKSLKIETLRKWEEQQVKIGNTGLPLKLKEVLGHHGAEIWCYSCVQEAVCQSYLRIFLPAVTIQEPEDISVMSAVHLESRPEFYDFDLFNQPGQTVELDEILLTDLTFTVFDTETTGLDPKTDEIISIGAIRIVNSRLLQNEIFDQLIDPKRSVPYESVKIHGIRPEMLEGQPTLDQALPLFHAFAEGTILVAHNAAFDMRMLQMKEESTGIRFINPVLDTLLLSAVVHPAQDKHTLEAIGKRLGVNIIGRHTALGDAIATGEIFLKLVPLLIKSGVKTLKDARLASQKTYYARLKY